MKTGRKTLQNLCSSFLGFVFVIALAAAAIPGGFFSKELILCGIASSLQCWAMCWNLSVCERDLMDPNDLRNDEEVVAKGLYEQKSSMGGMWIFLCQWLLLASRLSSWVFTASILCTWWSISMHWTVWISISANVIISIILGLATLWKSHVFLQNEKNC
jgi:hypothetical protein